MRQGDLYPVAERLGNEVIEFKNVSKTFGDRLLIDNLSWDRRVRSLVLSVQTAPVNLTLFKMIGALRRRQW